VNFIRLHRYSVALVRTFHICAGVFFLFFAFISIGEAQLQLNEVCSANLVDLADEDGDFGDWIELKSLQSGVNAGDYYLSDQRDSLLRWQLPNVELTSGELSLIFASGKNRSPVIDHFEAAVLAEDTWKYRVPANSLEDATWFLPFFDDSAWDTGPGGIGYGDGDDGTSVLPCTSVYMRKSFVLSEPSQVVSAALFMDFDDGFVAYLNGIEIARSNMGSPGSPISYTQFATGLREAQLYQGGIREKFEVDPDMIALLLVEGENVLAVQAHNYDVGSSDLSCIPSLILGVANDVVQTNEAPDWHSDPVLTEWHGNFKLSSGEWLYLSDGNGNPLDSVQIPFLEPGHSYMRNFAEWCISASPDPGTENVGICFAGYAPEVQFSVPAGIYAGGVGVELGPIFPQAEIRYTTDGSLPTEASALYSGPLWLTESTVVSARVFAQGGLLPSPVRKNSYLIDEEGLSIPVISISTNPENLWSDSIGIYVLGTDYQNWWPYYGANFWEDWERMAYIEYFDGDSIQQFEGSIGLKIFGGASRTQAQKSLRVKCRDEYGMEEIQYPLIPGKPHIDTFRNINLRNGSQDFYGSRMRDAYMNEVMRGTHADVMGYRHVVVFLNGEYWGHHELRETMNNHYVEDNHGVDADNVTIIANGYDNGVIVFQALDGELDDYYAMWEPLVYGDPSSDAFYALADSLLDLRNFADYTIAETYFGNGDWSSGYPNNMKCWGAPGKKWKHMLWDLDFGLGLYNNNPYANYLAEAHNDWFHYDRLCNALFQNIPFRQYFINRYADLINTVYQQDNMVAIGTAMRAELEPAIARHHQRWGGDYWSFYNGMEAMFSYNQTRIQAARDIVQSHFSLPGQVDITLEVFPPGAGRIHISTIEPSEEEYPWNGVYFNGVPVRITALANPGFEFNYWLPNALFADTIYTADTTLVFSLPCLFSAVFQGEPEATGLLISELMYHPDSSQSAGEWLEFYNPLDVPVSLSGLYLKDSNYFHRYDFPFNSGIAPGGHLVLAQDSAAFAQEYPEVDYVFGPLAFGFSNAGERITLFNHAGDTVALLIYSDSIPWPLCPDGCGRSLEAVVPAAFLTTEQDWFTGCAGGSPGSFYSPCNWEVVISEINYNSSPLEDAGDWLELYNPGIESLSMGNWQLCDDGDDSCFVFPPQFVLEANSYAVLASFPELFEEVHTEQVPAGTLPFNLSSEAESLKLYDEYGNMQFSMMYSGDGAWPQEANGLGKTLELLNLNGEFCDPLNWFAGCERGSPGAAFDPECPEPEITGAAFIDNPAVDIYPNPAREFIVIRGLVSGSGVQILDLQGRIVYSGILNGERLLLPLGLPEGMYVLVYETNGLGIAQKIAISR